MKNDVNPPPACKNISVFILQNNVQVQVCYNYTCAPIREAHNKLANSEDFRKGYCLCHLISEQALANYFDYFKNYRLNDVQL